MAVDCQDGVLVRVGQRDFGREVCPPRHASPPGVPLLVQSVITRVIQVAAGPFAPGHLGELTLYLPTNASAPVSAAGLWARGVRSRTSAGSAVVTARGCRSVLLRLPSA